MLRAIELSGFKSFADRTRLEFVDGVSALVGPNGSGKSNIVDAIKWVLGERSPKKLRGGEMTDVIFSGSAGRQAIGAAEVTLTFDNSAKIFGIDAPEVHIGRRIYRSGEGEYLINRQTVRLKDVEDILSGTGLGNQAYSIIEQGRVESLLQSSSVQRRAIFEEAAGISRYNTRKQEFQKRLERSDQNLVRLSDLVSERESQLKAARHQAGKAQLHRQYSARLQELRIQASLTDYRKRGSQCKELQTTIETLTAAERELTEAVDLNEKRLAERNESVEAMDTEIRRLKDEIAAIREKISGGESTVKSKLGEIEQIDKEILDNGRRLVEQNAGSGDIEEQLRKVNDDVRKERDSHTEVSETYQKILRQGEELKALCKEKQDERKSVRKELEAKHRQTAELIGTISGLESRITALQHSKDQSIARQSTLQNQRDDLIRQGEELRSIVGELHATAERKREQLDAAKLRKSNRAKELVVLSQELSELKQRQSGMRERIAVLEDLNRKYEGLSTGVRDVLDQAKKPKSPFRFVHGVVGNLMIADPEVAPLIDLALGPHAQYVVVEWKPELFRHIDNDAMNLPGRVGFIWLRPSEKEPAWMREKGFLGRPGVHGRADQFVNADAPYLHLARRLLARTWIVENMSVARALYMESDGQTNFLTVSGELLTAEGALVVGPVQKSSGLITRRAELRTLGEQMLTLDAAVAEKEHAVAVAAERSKDDDKEFETETRQHQKAVSEYDAGKSELAAADKRIRQATEQYEHLVGELDKLDTQIQRASDELEQTKTNREGIDEQIAVLERRLIETQQQVEESEQHHSEHLKTATNAKIELAKSEERLDAFKDKIRQFEERLAERQTNLMELRRRSLTLKNRREDAEMTILRIESGLALLYLKKESTMAAAGESLVKRTESVSERVAVQAEWKRQQSELNKRQSKRHTKQLELERLLQEQKTLLDRIRDDYDIDLTDLPQDDGNEFPNTEHQTPNTEIEELRRKIQKLGNVNLESIETLEVLESDYTKYITTYNDIMEGKKKFAKGIEDVEVRYRQLFEETFEGVRHHFKELFQRLFGGGHADLVLEDPNNLMETGVDIIARPPGKDLKSVSLLSGGEKTLTCVALLLAFFKFRPNPVCILDEVDAALDEANIDRFIRVVKEFGTKTQFLIITHSKRTMTAATTFYGVTMQESGVSKSVSVRFGDIGENGEILSESGRRAA